MNDEVLCADCGRPLPAGATICTNCGWDLTTSVAPPRRRLLAVLAGGGWRLLVYGLIAATPLFVFQRLRTTGVGPDLPTTLAWVVTGDGGRSAELVTLHRAHEIGAAATRFAIMEAEAPDFSTDWAAALGPYATMNVRGWIPLLFYGVDTELATAKVREIFAVRAVDGWGRPYRVTTMALPRGVDPLADPTVGADLKDGLQTSFFTLGRPDFAALDWLRVQLESAGRDGLFGSGDDLLFVTYVPVGQTFHLREDAAERQRRLERAYLRGRHYYRYQGSGWDLIDARLLAEFRFEAVW
jgi:hypothetical protein